MTLVDVNSAYTDLVETVFSSPIAAKAWLATAALLLVIVQVLTASRLWGKLRRVVPLSFERSKQSTAGRAGSHPGGRRSSRRAALAATAPTQQVARAWQRARRRRARRRRHPGGAMPAGLSEGPDAADVAAYVASIAK